MGIAERWSRVRPLPADIVQRLALVPDLCARHGVRLAYVFGSLARPAGSRLPNDVDLAVLPTTATDLWALRLDLAASLGTERLDVLDLGTASPVSRFEVVRTGRLVFRESVDAENDFERRVLAEYKDREVVRRRQRAWMREALGR